LVTGVLTILVLIILEKIYTAIKEKVYVWDTTCRILRI
jgi:hypothetical protein